MSREQARQLVSDFLARERASVGDWQFDVVSLEPDQFRKGDWSVVVDLVTPPDTVFAGPEILIVNGETGDVKTLASFYE